MQKAVAISKAGGANEEAEIKLKKLRGGKLTVLKCIYLFGGGFYSFGAVSLEEGPCGPGPDFEEGALIG